MQPEVTIREYRKEDAPCLETIIRKTWGYDSFCSDKVAKQLARIYLASCLGEQTFTRVALVNGKVEGIIMAKHIAGHKKKCSFIWNQIRCAAPLVFSREGRKTANMFAGINTLDEQLLKQTNKQFDGEIAFFAISETCRGLGIGKSLFQRALTYLEQQKAESYYLYTDSTCNYGFYEHQGMKRCGETLWKPDENVKNEIHFFIYEGNVHEFGGI